MKTKIITNKDIQDLLCRISQLIQGWNATEAEWSEWDKKVYQEITDMQLNLKNQIYNPLKFAEWCMFDGAGKYEGSMKMMLKEYIEFNLSNTQIT